MCFDCDRSSVTICLKITAFLNLNNLNHISSFFIQQDKMLSGVLFSTEAHPVTLFVYTILFETDIMTYLKIYITQNISTDTQREGFIGGRTLKYGRAFLVIIYDTFSLV